MYKSILLSLSLCCVISCAGSFNEGQPIELTRRSVSDISQLPKGKISFWGINYGVSKELNLKPITIPELDNIVSFEVSYTINPFRYNSELLSKEEKQQLKQIEATPLFAQVFKDKHAKRYSLVAIDNNASVWQCEYDYNLKEQKYEYDIKHISSLTNIVDVATNGDTHLALKDDGNLWGWGKLPKPYGKCEMPTKIKFDGHVVGVYLTDFSILVLNTKGELWEGREETLKEYRGVRLYKIKWELVASNARKIVSADKRFISTDNKFTNGNNSQYSSNMPSPKSLEFDGGITDIACGDSFHLALTANNKLFSYGVTKDGSLGDGKMTSWQNYAQVDIDPIKQVVANDNRAAALTQDGSVWEWGAYDSEHIIGATPTKRDIENVVYIDAAGYFTFALQESKSAAGGE